MASYTEIDGSFGEGGGQILRSSMALAAISGQAIRIQRIRAKRPKPGLQRQHLVAVQAAAAISNGSIHDDNGEACRVGDRSLIFHPGTVAPGCYEFDIGSAGSTNLVLQTVLWPLLLADGDSAVCIRGGTHNDFAPTTEFLQECWLPVLRRMNIDIDLVLERHGFNPAGGGCIRVHIRPWRYPKALDLMQRGKPGTHSAVAMLANLPRSIGEREMDALKHKLHWPRQHCQVQDIDADGQANLISAKVIHEHITEVFTSHGRFRLPAEQVAQRCARDIRKYLKSDAPVGEHLADQLLIPMALGAGGQFRCTSWSEHSRTNAALLKQLLGVDFRCQEDGKTMQVSLHT